MNSDYDGMRVVISAHFAGHSIGIWLIRRRVYDGAPVTAVAAPIELNWVDHEEATMLPAQPTLMLPDGLGRSFLDELTVHYGGHSDVRSLRRDYDAERKRVDRLTEAVIAVTSR